MTRLKNMQEMTVEEAIESVADSFSKANLFYGHGTDNALDEAAWAVHHVLKLDYSGPLQQYQTIVSKKDMQAIQSLTSARIETRKPMAYLTQQMWFAGIEFFVDERVLVPRSPISELIQSHFHPWLDISKVSRVIDLCTGSGCIGMALALHQENITVTCTDISQDALAVAELNRQRLGLQSRVTLAQADLFDGVETELYDLIISNPPYVDKDDMDALMQEFKHEPELGLASGDDGLIHTRRILHSAAHYLKPEGNIIIEVGNSMHALQTAYPSVPFMWLEFSQGGDGVFMLSGEQLREHFS